MQNDFFVSVNCFVYLTGEAGADSRYESVVRNHGHLQVEADPNQHRSRVAIQEYIRCIQRNPRLQMLMSGSGSNDNSVPVGSFSPTMPDNSSSPSTSSALPQSYSSRARAVALAATQARVFRENHPHILFHSELRMFCQ